MTRHRETFTVKRFGRFQDERGIAMVTVLLIGAVLTAVTSAAAFTTVQQLQASGDDRRGAQSLAFAEAGIDRLILEMKQGNVTWGDLRRAGCNPVASDSDPDYVEFSGAVGTGGGNYVTRLMVYNKDATGADRYPPAACSPVREDPKQVNYFLIESTGSQPAARRVVRQVVQITALGLPIGLFAYSKITCSGSPSMRDISLITQGTIERRDFCPQSGTDPYYTRAMFHGATAPDTPIPAAAHALGQITYGPGGQPKQEHRAGFEPNCEANDRGTLGQSLWDGSGTAVLTSIAGCPVGQPQWGGSAAPSDSALPGVAADQRPPNSLFDDAAMKAVAKQPTLEKRDYDTLKEAAKTQGLYCKTSAVSGKLDCIKQNVSLGNSNDTVINANSPFVTGHRNVYVAFFDLGGSVSSVTWKEGVEPCSDNPETNRSIVLVVKNGDITFSGGSSEPVTGAVLAPEGTVATEGSSRIIGTVIAKTISGSGGGGTEPNFSLTGCWVRNLPGPFLDVTPIQWSEVDR